MENITTQPFLMTYGDFLKLVADMRDSQNVYFKTRNTRALIAAKELEKKVDDVIKLANNA